MLIIVTGLVLLALAYARAQPDVTPTIIPLPAAARLELNRYEQEFMRADDFEAAVGQFDAALAALELKTAADEHVNLDCEIRPCYRLDRATRAFRIVEGTPPPSTTAPPPTETTTSTEAPTTSSTTVP